MVDVLMLDVECRVDMDVVPCVCGCGRVYVRMCVWESGIWVLGSA